MTRAELALRTVNRPIQVAQAADQRRTWGAYGLCTSCGGPRNYRDHHRNLLRTCKRCREQRRDLRAYTADARAVAVPQYERVTPQDRQVLIRDAMYALGTQYDRVKAALDARQLPQVRAHVITEALAHDTHGLELEYRR